ncbi:serine hydrolase domain-containing protein [Catellatospora citrea]|uniref:Esterase n=1 Tax=Catellatospora citrea TaxID=53366 RepID=A0A8J3K6F8_9ACTN|nr:serine hydrolase domain-containing protein [Catellatospora citrea]RKE06789.1 CubicO group peptidase (beta-lactamase class C family) [Catellatospora citrea]GIF94934.1 esterase [Catellatospora citrea]
MTWHHLQQRVQQHVDDLVDSGQETGVQVAAYLHGEPIVDVAAGLADPATGRPVTPGTPFFSYSTGKALTSTVVHVLAEQGRLDYDLRIADVWPEFARHGKSGVTLRHALTHTAGLPALPPDVTAVDLADWDRMCAIMADATPVWEPGTAHGYHVWTYGWLVGETVRRATGRTVSQVLAADVAAPLGVPGELLLGVPEQDLDSLAVLSDRSWSDALKQLSAQLPNFDRAVPHGARPDADLGNDRAFLRADVPAVGTVSARAAARMYAALLGEVDGVRLISPARLQAVSTPLTRGPEWTFGMPVRWTLGYAVDGPMIGVGGLGGSLAGALPELGLAVAATKNALAVGDGDPMEWLREMIVEAVRRAA